jgi:two-component system sensor histidine kinase KdpD
MMAESRPDPDELLARVKADEVRARRGRLRIFFGATAGVGKTYSMLEAARNAAASGTEVVIGYIEPHGRIDTERLMEGLEKLPTFAVHYRDIVRQEFDLDAALKRKPAILLVDELAHSNVVGGEPAPRHPKRWQDIEELLDAGINVWTTVNVQHLESLNDIVAQITGVKQRETLPDRIFDEADEVELIDLPPDDLIARLHAGKIYVPGEVRTAVDRFFRRPNLLAMRELALRRTTDRVEASARASMDATSRGYLARDRVLVAVGPDAQAEQLVRAAKRIAAALDASWTAIYVETPGLRKLSDADRNRRIDVLRLAESLGAETVTLDGPSASAAIAEYARTRQATRVIVGSPKRRGWRAWLRPSTTHKLIAIADGFDVITVAHAERVQEHRRVAGAEVSPKAGASARSPEWKRYGWALGISAISTAIAFSIYPFLELVNLVMVYLLGVTVAGLRLGRGPSVLTSITSVLAFDFCFVPPRFTLAVADAQYLITFLVMLIVALVIATLMASVRQQTRVAGARERRTALLYAMSRELTAARGVDSMARVAVRHVAEVFQSQAVVLLPDASGKLGYPREPRLDGSFLTADLAVAQWVADHGRRAGLGSDTLPASLGAYLPLSSGERNFGVLAVLPGNPRRVLLPEQSHLLETFAGQIALALERVQLSEMAESARVAAEAEGFRNTLLASISHDLRTPLAVIAGAGSTLARKTPALDEGTRISLGQSIEGKARQMSELVSNVLDLLRLESGQVILRKDWQALDDLIGTALHRLEERLLAHPVEVNVADDLPEVRVDATLIVQVLYNLLDNAAKHTPPGTRIWISATVDGDFVRMVVDDEGPGLPHLDPTKLFDKFQRGNQEGPIVGVGLGLTICRAIVQAHGGTIEARHRASGGARFEFTLPLSETAA